MASAITATNLTKHFPGVVALENLTIDVPQGSIYGFLGANGAGKTTAIKILAGLSRPTSGSASVAGIPLTAGESYKAKIGYLGQEPRFYGWMTGRQVLAYVGGFYPHVEEPLHKRIAEVLDRVGIADAADRPTRTYSGGMRQRLGIAQALVGRPEVLLLDEPASALDPVGRRDVLDLMSSLRSHATIFYSTHILGDVQRVSDHVAIIDKGRLVRAAATADLLASFTHDRVRVVLRGADDQTASGLRALPDVVDVQLDDREGDRSTYTVAATPDAADRVQAAVTRFAVDSGLTLVENAPERLDLEDVFLRLIDPRERAA